MLKIEHTDVYGWEAAIRGMRNPMNSWDMSDSYYGCTEKPCAECEYREPCNRDYNNNKPYIIGENDLKLMKSLSKAGNDHGKFLRFINVTVDITAPLYWWKEFDTYKVGTVANSCSTMHKIHAKKFTMDDFSHEHLSNEHFTKCHFEKDEIQNDGEISTTSLGWLSLTIGMLNIYRYRYLRVKEQNPKEAKKYWWQMIQLLPSSYNQKRTMQLNYQVLKSMYFARRNHKLDEWHTLCSWMEELPYFKEVCLNDCN